jgi:hypothetical protein
LPRVAVTDTSVAFVIGFNGLEAAIATSRESLRADQLIQLSPGGYRDPAIASDGTNALVVWVEFDNLYAMRIGPEVNALSRQVLATNVGLAAPAVAWNGSKYVIAWSQASNAILATTVERSGEYAGRITVIQHNGERVPKAISIASSNGDSLLVWDRYTYDPTCAFLCSPILQAEVDSVVLDPDGHPRNASSILSPAGYDPDVASDGHEYFAIWTGFPNRGLFGRAVASDGMAQESVRIASEPDYQGRIAWNGVSFYIVWLHQVFATYFVSYAPMDEHGTVGAPIQFAGRSIFDFDIAARSSGLVVLIHSSSGLPISPATVCYLDVRRRSVTR